MTPVPHILRSIYTHTHTHARYGTDLAGATSLSLSLSLAVCVCVCAYIYMHIYTHARTRTHAYARAHARELRTHFLSLSLARSKTHSPARAWRRGQNKRPVQCSQAPSSGIAVCPSVQRAHRADAIRTILTASDCQSRVKVSTGFYDTSRCLKDPHSASYEFRIQPANDAYAVSYTITALPLDTVDDDCGALSLDHAGTKGISASGGNVSRCWGGR